MRKKIYIKTRILKSRIYSNICQRSKENNPC